MATTTTNAKATTTAQQLGSIIKSARDIMRKDKGLNGDLDRLPMLTWVLFLKFLDDLEHEREDEAFLANRLHFPAIEPPYRWREWAVDEDGITGEAYVGDEDASLTQLQAITSTEIYTLSLHDALPILSSRNLRNMIQVSMGRRSRSPLSPLSLRMISRADLMMLPSCWAVVGVGAGLSPRDLCTARARSLFDVTIAMPFLLNSMMFMVCAGYNTMFMV